MSREVHRKTEESKVSVQCIDEDEFIASVEPSLCSEPGHADVNDFFGDIVFRPAPAIDALRRGRGECGASTPSPSVFEGNHGGTKPSFLMEKIARRVAMPFCFCWKMASLYCISSGNCRSDTIFCSKQKGLEHLGSVIAHTDIIHVVR